MVPLSTFLDPGIKLDDGAALKAAARKGRLGSFGALDDAAGGRVHISGTVVDAHHQEFQRQGTVSSHRSAREALLRRIRVRLRGPSQGLGLWMSLEEEVRSLRRDDKWNGAPLEEKSSPNF